MNSRSTAHGISLDRPTPWLARWMVRLGWIGVALAVPALLTVGWCVITVSSGAAEIEAMAEPLRWSARVAISGLLLGAIGFWDR